jgi:hypothetical protein
MTSFYSIILTKYLLSTNDLYTCSWFSWTFTNIKQVVLHILNTDEQLDLRYTLYSKTFAPQCEVKIIVFIVLLIDANYATFYFIL